MGNREILLLDGDNNFFPVVYGRIVERMREDILLFDRHKIVYKLPYLGEERGIFYGNYDSFRTLLEKSLVAKMGTKNISYAIFDPEFIILPAEYTLVPQGMLYRVVKKKELINPYKIRNLWRYYSTESFYDHFERDFFTRQIGAFFFFRQGKYLFLAGQQKNGLEYLRKASKVGFNDTGIHSMLAGFLIEQGLFEDARLELVKSMDYHTDLSVVYNNWGVYHYKRGVYKEAIRYFQKAIRIHPEGFLYHKNLGYALHGAGEKEDAILAFEKSLAINEDQEEIIKFMKENGLK